MISYLIVGVSLTAGYSQQIPGAASQSQRQSHIGCRIASVERIDQIRSPGRQIFIDIGTDELHIVISQSPGSVSGSVHELFIIINANKLDFTIPEGEIEVEAQIAATGSAIDKSQRSLLGEFLQYGVDLFAVLLDLIKFSFSFFVKLMIAVHQIYCFQEV